MGEEASGVGIGRGREGAKGGSEQWREENFKGDIPRRAHASVQYIHKPFHNGALGLVVQALYDMTSHKLQHKLFYLFCTPEGILFDM